MPESRRQWLPAQSTCRSAPSALLSPSGLRWSIATGDNILSPRLCLADPTSQQMETWIALAGEDAAIEIVRPLLPAISRGYTVVGSEPKQSHALKLGGNFMITAMVQALSEAFVFAEAQGVDPKVFLDTVNSALFQSPFYAAYGKVMLDPPEHPGATVALGIKDTRLLRESAKAVQTRLPLADHLAGMLRVASEFRHAPRRLGSRTVQDGAIRGSICRTCERPVRQSGTTRKRMTHHTHFSKYCGPTPASPREML